MTTSERRLSRPHIDAGEYWPSPTLLRIRRRRSPLHQFAESLLERTRLASASNTTAILGGMPFFSILQLNLRKVKLEKILKGSLDSIPSPSSSVKIQIMGGEVCLRWKGKTLLGVVNKLLKSKSLLTSPRNFLPLKF